MAETRSRQKRYLPYIKRQQLIWLAGLWEGEGSFCKPSPSRDKEVKCSIGMCDEDVIKHVAKLLGVKYTKIHTEAMKEKQHSARYTIQFRGTRAEEFMRLVRPFMFSRRQKAIDDALSAVEEFILRSYLTDYQVNTIIGYLILGYTRQELAETFNVTPETIGLIDRKQDGRSKKVAEQIGSS